VDISDYDYQLPATLIAQEPPPQRQDSRLLIVDRASGRLRHGRFPDLAGLLQPGDLLVMNNTRVIPARLYGHKDNTGGKVEFLLVHPRDELTWEALVRPGRRIQVGHRIFFGDGRLSGEVVERLPGGRRVIRFCTDEPFAQVLKALGEVPLPPYVHQALRDPERYQTVYARPPGSVAAPTAGLHFTASFIESLHESGIGTAFVTLHVGPGTFRPVKTAQVEDHVLDPEYWSLPADTARVVNLTRERGGRIVAVGTTAVRTLESSVDDTGKVMAGNGWTGLFIRPGFEFRVVDRLLTNFHLPRSTLLLLVSALAGRELVMKAYAAAVEREYRFYSFGDAMFII